jgi:hypothetical protein
MIPLDNGINALITSLSKQSHHWKTVGQLQEKDKLSIDKGKHPELEKGTEEDVIRISKAGYLQGLIRTINRMFYGTVADRDSTFKWLAASRQATQNNVEELMAKVRSTEDDPRILGEAKEALKGLEQSLQQAPNGYDQLMFTYNGDFTERYRAEKDLIKNKLMQSVSKALEEIDQRLDRFADKEVKEFREAVSRLDLNREKLLQEEAKQLVNPFFQKQWEMEAKSIQAGPDNFLKAVFNRSKLDPTAAPKEIMTAKNNDNLLVPVKTKKGEVVQMPAQYEKDVKRSDEVVLENIVLFKQANEDQNDIAEGYRTLQKTFGEKGAERIARILTQSLTSDLATKISLMYSNPEEQKIQEGVAGQKKTIQINERLIVPQGSYISFQLEHKGDKVHIAMRLYLTTKDARGELMTRAIMVRREIEIPLEELNDPELENSKNPLPNLTVQDTVSREVTEEAAELLYRYF